MSKKSQARREAEKEAKFATKRAIQQQFAKGTANRPGLKLEELRPSQPKDLGRFSFLSRKHQKKFVNAARFALEKEQAK